MYEYTVKLLIIINHILVRQSYNLYGFSVTILLFYVAAGKGVFPRVSCIFGLILNQSKYHLPGVTWLNHWRNC